MHVGWACGFDSLHRPQKGTDFILLEICDLHSLHVQQTTLEGETGIAKFAISRGLTTVIRTLSYIFFSDWIVISYTTTLTVFASEIAAAVYKEIINCFTMTAAAAAARRNVYVCNMKTRVGYTFLRTLLLNIILFYFIFRDPLNTGCQHHSTAAYIILIILPRALQGIPSVSGWKGTQLHPTTGALSSRLSPNSRFSSKLEDLEQG